MTGFYHCAQIISHNLMAEFTFFFLPDHDFSHLACILNVSVEDSVLVSLSRGTHGSPAQASLQKRSYLSANATDLQG